MKYEIKDEGGKTALNLREQLTIADRTVFDGILPGLVKVGRPITVNLSHLEYMDSSGLGMLLTLREQADKAGLKVNLRVSEGDVKDLLRLSCFDTLFSIE